MCRGREFSNLSCCLLCPLHCTGPAAHNPWLLAQDHLIASPHQATPTGMWKLSIEYGTLKCNYVFPLGSASLGLL